MTAPATAKRAQGGMLTGTGVLLRLALRRDRVRLPAWLAGVTGFVVASAVGLVDLVPDAAARATRAELMSSPTILALRGPGYGLDDYTVGAMIAHELLLYPAVAVALMAMLMVTRHTRAEEEAARTELLRAAVLGRHAALTAALTLATAASVAAAGLTTVGLLAAIDGLDPAGAAAFGLALATSGVVFAAVAAVCGQASEHARAANGYAGIVLAVAFVVRAVGDARGVDDRALSWLSPLGWVQSTRPFVDERLWPLAPAVVLAAVLVVVAGLLATRRDLGAGLLPPRPGPASASETLARPWGLAWRLHRTALAGWATGTALLGASFGAIVGDIDRFLTQNPQLADIFGDGGGRLLDAFLATVMLLVALLATAFALQVTLRLRTEEADGRAEPLLTAGLTRLRWTAGHLAVALLGGVVVACAGGLGLGVAAAVDQSDPQLIAELLVAGLAAVPAIWVTVGLVVAAYGLLPRATGIGWLIIAYAAFIGLLGGLLDLPDAVRGLSPYHHSPELPGGDVELAALAGLITLAVALLAAGVAGFTRRDLHTT